GRHPAVDWLDQSTSRPFILLAQCKRREDLTGDEARGDPVAGQAVSIEDGRRRGQGAEPGQSRPRAVDRTVPAFPERHRRKLRMSARQTRQYLFLSGGTSFEAFTGNRPERDAAAGDSRVEPVIGGCPESGYEGLGIG